MAINDPRDIPGLVAWYSAEAPGAAYLDGDRMTAGWADLSGNGNHGIHANFAYAEASSGGVTWRATFGANGGPAVWFDGSAAATVRWDRFDLPDLMNGYAAGELFTSHCPLTTNNAFHRFGSDTLQAHVPYTDTTVYENFGRGDSVRPGFTSTPGSWQAWHRYNISASAASWRAFQNNVQKFSGTASIGWRTDPALGSSGGNPFNGYVGCVLLYSRALTDTERADLDAWMQANPSGGTTGPVAPAVALGGTSPVVAGAFDLTAAEPPPTMTLASTAPAMTGAFGASVAAPPISTDLAGNAPKVAGSFGIELAGVASGNLAATVPAVYGSLAITASSPAVEVTTNAVNRLNGMTLVTEWQVEVNPAVTEPKRQRAHDYAIAVSLTEPTLVDGRPT